MKKYIILLAITSLLFFVACEDRSDLTAPSAPDTGSADFTRFVSLGNSLTAGYQNASVYESSQVYSFGKIIADQVGVSYAQPIISEPGIPGKLELHDLTPTILPNPGLGEPTNTTYAAPYNNLGVPGAILWDLTDETDLATKTVQRENPYFQIVMRDQATFGASLVKQALNLQPTFINLWIGNNDVLGYATSGGTSGTDQTGLLPTDPNVFAFLYNQVATLITDTTGARKIAAGNIPDVQNIPYFTTIGPKVAASLEAGGVPAMVYQSTHTGVGYGVATIANLNDGTVLLTLTGSSATAYLGDRTGAYYTANGISVPPGVVTDSAFGFSPFNPWPDNLTLEPAEIVISQDATNAFNATIQATVNANSATWILLDMNMFFDEVADGGMVIDGIQFTTDFIVGNTFSLDGVHPTTQAYGVIANEFIDEINRNFDASIPRINVSTLPGSIPLGKVSF